MGLIAHPLCHLNQGRMLLLSGLIIYPFILLNKGRMLLGLIIYPFILLNKSRMSLLGFGCLSIISLKPR